MYDHPVDGIFGKMTHAAVEAFQEYHPELVVDGIVGPITWGRLLQATEALSETPERDATPPVQSTDQWPKVPEELLDHLKTSIDHIVQHGVVYGPGRGYVRDGKFIVTIGPFGLGGANYAAVKKGPAFVCSTFTYFMASLIFRLNEKFNAARSGGVPSVFEVYSKPFTLHNIKSSKWGYYGFEPFLRVVPSNGRSGGRRKSLAKRGIDMDLLEIYHRRHKLPEIMFCGQAFASKGFHSHTAIMWIDRHSGRVFRCAADGSKRGGKFSSTKMNIEEITEEHAKANHSRGWYRCYGVIPDNLEELVLGRPALPVAFEDKPNVVVDP